MGITSNITSKPSFLSTPGSFTLSSGGGKRRELGENPKSKAGLKNEGKDCWKKCKKKGGPCKWCGATGYCCKKGEAQLGCTTTMGSSTQGHRCVAGPLTKSNSESKAGLKNEGKDCWKKCKKKDGPCKWCGATGYCCKKGKAQLGCTTTMGSSTKGHRCVAGPVTKSNSKSKADLKNEGKDCWKKCKKKMAHVSGVVLLATAVRKAKH